MIILSVCIITYNHEKYIAQAIESALMQKTDFYFEIVIGEDYSTDKTSNIVIEYAKKYSDKIKVVLNERNIGPILNFSNTLRMCHGKYIAMLEGDDYWTDPLKLKKQVDFLEANPDYGLVHSDVNILFQKQNILCQEFNKSKNINIPTGDIYNELLIRDFIYTPTVLFRFSLIQESSFIDTIISQKWLMGDYPLWLEISAKSKAGYFNTAMATYRYHQTSYSRRCSEDEFNKSTYSVKRYFISKYVINDEMNNKINFDYHRTVLLNWYTIKDIELVKSSYYYLKSEGFACYQMSIIKYFILSIPILWPVARVCAKVIKYIKNQL